VESCKFDAIWIKEKAATGIDLAAYKDVWVYAEQHDGQIQSITYELLGEGRKLADALGMKLCAVCWAWRYRQDFRTDQPRGRYGLCRRPSRTGPLPG